MSNKEKIILLHPMNIPWTYPLVTCTNNMDIPMKYSLVIPTRKYPLPTWTYYLPFSNIPYPLIFGQTFALIKPFDSEQKNRHGR